MAMSAEHRSKICSPSPEMMTSPYEWKILELDDKPQANKQTCIANVDLSSLHADEEGGIFLMFICWDNVPFSTSKWYTVWK